MDINKDTFCSRPFNEINIDIDGGISPCCTMYGKPYESINHYLNSDFLKDLKKDLTTGVKSTSCFRCWKHENRGTWSNRELNEIKDFISYAHIKFSNKCNLKCLMCNKYHSSAIGQEETGKTNIVNAFDNNVLKEDFYNNILPKLEIVCMSGGEPFLSDDHLHFLLHAHKVNPDLMLIYNSNVTTSSYKGYNFVDLWKKYKEVWVSPSVDGFGNIQEYQRYGSKWEIIEENLLYFKNYINFIHCCVSIYNISNITKLINWCVKHNTKIRFFYVSDLWLDAITLPKLEKKLIIEEYKQLKNIPEDLQLEIKNNILVPLLNEVPEKDRIENNKKFKGHTKKKDRIRNKSFIEEVPLLKEWYEKI